MNNQVTILSLNYSINFRDADEGDCYAGEGRRIIAVCRDPKVAEAVICEFSPAFTGAEKENIVFPVQRHNQLLKQKFGFTLHDIGDGYDFKLTAETFDVLDVAANVSDSAAPKAVQAATL